MITSAQQLFSNAQAIVADAISENVIDLGVAGTPYDAQAPLHKDIGKGNPIPVLIQVVENFDAATSLTITVETDSAAGLSTAPVVLATETILLADLVAGKQTFLQCLPNGVTGRYLGIRYNVNGANPTVGKITAGITMGNQTNVTGA